MREAKKQQALAAKKDAEATFKPKLFTKSASRSKMTSMGDSGGAPAHERLYKVRTARAAHAQRHTHTLAYALAYARARALCPVFAAARPRCPQAVPQPHRNLYLGASGADLGGASSSDRHSDRHSRPRRRLQAAAAKDHKQAKAREQAWDDEMTFQPDISKSQAACESMALPGARHMALFMQGEIMRQRKVWGGRPAF